MVSHLDYFCHLLTGLIPSLVDSYNPFSKQQILITLEFRSCYSQFKSCQGLPTALKIHFHTLDCKALYIRVLIYFLLHFMSYSNLFLFVLLFSHQSCPTVLWPPRTTACQVPLSVGFSRQEYWSGLPFLSPGDLPNSGIKPMSPALAGGFFTIKPPGKRLLVFYFFGHIELFPILGPFHKLFLQPKLLFTMIFLHLAFSCHSDLALNIISAKISSYWPPNLK